VIQESWQSSQSQRADAQEHHNNYYLSSQCSFYTNGAGLLSIIKVTEATDVASLVLIVERDLHPAHAEHQVEVAHHFIAGGGGEVLRAITFCGSESVIVDKMETRTDVLCALNSVANSNLWLLAAENWRNTPAFAGRENLTGRYQIFFLVKAKQGEIRRAGR
jgi:hypothetical protein